MERDNRLKRARDIEGDENREYHVDKKLETIVDDEGSFGVFDFPWLKEGSFVAADDFLELHHDVFSPCFEIQDAAESDHHQPNSNIVDQYSCMHQDSSLLLLDQDLLNYKFDFDDLDCVWSSVIDQPLDVNVYINKA